VGGGGDDKNMYFAKKKTGGSSNNWIRETVIKRSAMTGQTNVKKKKTPAGAQLIARSPGGGTKKRTEELVGEKQTRDAMGVGGSGTDFCIPLPPSELIKGSLIQLKRSNKGVKWKKENKGREKKKVKGEKTAIAGGGGWFEKNTGARNKGTKKMGTKQGTLPGVS